MKSAIASRPMPEVSRLGWRVHVGLIGLFFLIAVLMTFPMITAPHRLLIGTLGDSMVWPWNFTWTRQALLTPDHSLFFSEHAYRPFPTAFLHYTHTFFYGFIYTLGSWIDANPILWTNGFILASFVIAASGTFMLARQLSGHLAGALVAAVIFAFCTPRLIRVFGHLNLLSGEWIPWYLFCLVRAMQTNRPRFYLGMALTFAASTWNDYYQSLFIILFTLIFLLSTPWLRLHEGWAWRQRLRPVLPAAFLFILLICPLAWGLWLTTQTREISAATGADRFYVTPLNYILPGAYHRVLRTWLLEFYRFGLPGGEGEGNAFLGYTAMALALWGAFRSQAKHRYYFFFAIAGLIFMLLSFGRSLTFPGPGNGFDIPMPYKLLTDIPYFDDFRVPARFSVMVVLCLSILAAFGVRAIDHELARRSARLALPSILVFLILFENMHAPWPEHYNALEPLERGGDLIDTIRSDAIPGAVMTLPIRTNNWPAIWYQIFHHRPIVAGILSRPQPALNKYYNYLDIREWFEPDPQFRYVADDPLSPGWLEYHWLSRTLTQWEPEEKKWTPEKIRRFCYFFDLRFLLIPPHSRNTDMAGRLRESMFPLAGSVRQSNGWLGIIEKQPPEFPILIDGGSIADSFYFTRNFSVPAGGARWLFGTSGTITIRLDQPTDLTFQMLVRNGLHIAPERQRLGIRVAGRQLMDVKPSAEWEGWQCHIPRELTRTGYNDIRIETAVAKSYITDQIQEHRPISIRVGGFIIDRANEQN